jgi:hypothetical protein
VSGSYRFLDGGPIEGELRIYNFSDHAIIGHLAVDRLKSFSAQIATPNHFEVGPVAVRVVPVVFSRRVRIGYAREDWSAVFVDGSNRRSVVAFALETSPEDESESFEARPLAFASVGPAGSAHRFDPADEVTCRGIVWQGVNGVQLREPPARISEQILDVWVNAVARDPLHSKLAVAQVKGGLPAKGFLRVKLDRPMDRDFAVCVDLVDRRGQRFSIWENFGVDYFRPKATDVWLNLADFSPYFWGHCTNYPKLHPEQIEEVQLRFYIGKANDPRKISLSFMGSRLDQ